MHNSLVDISSNVSNESNSSSDTLFDNFFKIISLKENVDSNDAYPFNPCETPIIIKKEIFDKFNIIKISRRNKEDDIRKRFKSNFHKYLRNIINNKLQEAGSNYLLESFPQNFITDITKKTNFEVMELTYDQLFDYTYNQVINCQKNNKRKKYVDKKNKAAEKKCKKNKEVMEYLNNNKKISEESGWERIRKMKYIDLLKAYLNSNEFHQYIRDLCKKEKINYIKDFIYYASTYIDHYLSYRPKENNSQLDNNPLLISSAEININIPSLNIPLLMPFPPSKFEITDDNNLQDSLDLSNDEYVLLNSNNIFTIENSFFEKDCFQ